MADYKTFTTKSPNPLAKLWVDSCTIYEWQKVKDPVTQQTKQTKVPVLLNEPCRLSYEHAYSSGAPTKERDGVSVYGQQITLFIRPDLLIKPGSVIEVTQYQAHTAAATETFKASGPPALYTNHQEISLELYDGKA